MLIIMDQGFSFTPVPELSSDGIPFPKYILGLILCVIKDRAYLHLTIRNQKTKFFTWGNLGTLFDSVQIEKCSLAILLQTYMGVVHDRKIL